MFRWLSEKEIYVIFANSLLGAIIQDGGMSERSGNIISFAKVQNKKK